MNIYNTTFIFNIKSFVSFNFPTTPSFFFSATKQGQIETDRTKRIAKNSLQNKQNKNGFERAINPRDLKQTNANPCVVVP